MKRNKVLLFLSIAVALVLPTYAESNDNDNFGSVLQMSGINNNAPLLQSPKMKKIREKKKRVMNKRQCLWDASLVLLSSKPILVSDLKGGVLSTDWFEENATQNERRKWNIILSPGRSNPSVSVTIFKQTRTNGEWRDSGLDSNAASGIQNQLTNECSKVVDQDQ